jgi:hypothetical protein
MFTIAPFCLWIPAIRTKKSNHLAQESGNETEEIELVLQNRNCDFSQGLRAQNDKRFRVTQ